MLRLIVLLIAAGCAHVVPEGAEVRQRSLLAAGDADAALAAMDAELRALGGRPGGPGVDLPPIKKAPIEDDPFEGLAYCGIPGLLARQDRMKEWAKRKAEWRVGQPTSTPEAAPTIAPPSAGP
jgi:hypothetical protein